MSTLEKANTFRRDIDHLTEALAIAKEGLRQLEAACQHRWSKAAYNLEHHEGYHIKGDPEGTMGVDRELPMDVLPEDIPTWTRRCELCGREEKTTRTKVDPIARPVF